MRWIAGGIAGWVAAVLPLLGVNIAGYANILDTQTAAIAGAAALVGSVVLGGLVSGLIAGRAVPRRAGGATAALPAGIVAAFLYAASLIVVTFVAIRARIAPPIVADHFLRITGVIIFLGALMLGISLLVGALAGRRGIQAQTAASSVYGAPPSSPRREAYVSDGYHHFNDRGDRGDYAGHGHRGSQRDVGQGRTYSGPPLRQSSEPSQRFGGSGRSTGRDDNWR